MSKNLEKKHGGKRQGSGVKSSTGEKNDYVIIVVPKSQVVKFGGKKAVKLHLQNYLKNNY